MPCTGTGAAPHTSELTEWSDHRGVYRSSDGKLAVLINAYVRKVSFGADYEAHLNFYVESRNNFHALDSVQDTLVLGACALGNRDKCTTWFDSIKFVRETRLFRCEVIAQSGRMHVVGSICACSQTLTCEMTVPLLVRLQWRLVWGFAGKPRPCLPMR